jgi:serine protease inhibitor
MNLQDLISIIGIASAIISGVNFILIAVAKAFWSLTHKKLESDFLTLKKEFEQEKALSVEFRHKYQTAIESLTNLIEEKFRNFDQKLSDIKNGIQPEIRLAILINESKKKDDNK